MLEGETYLEYTASQLAASAIAIAHSTLELPVWPADFVKNTGYELRELYPCIEFLYRMFVQVCNFLNSYYKHSLYLAFYSVILNQNRNLRRG